MGALRILILTDSRVHGPVESIYHLAERMLRQDDVSHISVADRADPRNAEFFDVPTSLVGNVLDVNEKFLYSQDKSFYQQEGKAHRLEDFNAIFLRMPRSSSMPFFATLSRLNIAARCFNRPDGIMRTGAKDYLMNFQEFTAPIALVENLDEVDDFRCRFETVLKPLNDSGGKGIVRIRGNKVYRGNEAITWAEFQPQLEAHLEIEPYLAMKFLERVSEGDKRVIVVNGEIVSAALRVPADGSWLANVSQGGRSEISEPAPEEYEMAQALTPDLAARGVTMFGFDTLVGDDGRRVLSEINSSCVNGLYPAEMHSGKPVLARTARLLTDYIHEHIS